MDGEREERKGWEVVRREEKGRAEAGTKRRSEGAKEGVRKK